MVKNIWIEINKSIDHLMVMSKSNWLQQSAT